ncbi:MAG: hypothetical protein FJY10_08585 [Bacteroidetes bacterium]|nr:hypothetical protein [Bacteroidota bacterium]
MNFSCIELRITDDPGFGCIIQFSDTKDNEYDENQTTDEIINLKEKYFLIQRSYPEELYENDFYHIESSESSTELGYSDKILIDLSKDNIKIQWSGDKVELGLNIEEAEVLYLRKILKKRFKEKIILTEK